MERYKAVERAIQQIQASFPNTDLFVLLDSFKEGEGWSLKLGYLTYWTEEIVQANNEDESLTGEPCEYWISECFVTESDFDEATGNYDPNEHPWY